MNLSEIVDLIKIRDYLNQTINNFNIAKNTVTELNSMLILVDKQIVEKLTSSEFKKLINYSDKEKAMEEVKKIANIKSGLKY